MMGKINTEEQKLELVKYYLDGNSTFKCKEKFGIERKTIVDILKKHDVRMRTFFETNRIYSRNSNYFENINSPDKAYFLGWMISDGNISGNTMRVQIQSRDIEVLEKFKKYIEFSGKIPIYKRDITRQDKCVLDITDDKICQDLIKLGIIPAKSHFTYFPEIPEHLHSHFIRGVFDGDGSVYVSGKYKKQLGFSITGNGLLIDRIQEILVEKCGISNTKVHRDKRKNGDIAYLTHGGNKKCRRIYDWLYKDCGDLYLIRKKEKFDIKISENEGKK